MISWYFMPAELKAQIAVSDSLSETDEIITSPVSGLEELQDRKISIYPNPFNDQIDVENPGKMMKEISLADINGNIVITKICDDEEHQFLQTKGLRQGTYILIITDDKGTTYHKVLKN